MRGGRVKQSKAKQSKAKQSKAKQSKQRDSFALLCVWCFCGCWCAQSPSMHRTLHWCIGAASVLHSPRRLKRDKYILAKRLVVFDDLTKKSQEIHRCETPTTLVRYPSCPSPHCTSLKITQVVKLGSIHTSPSINTTSAASATH